MKNTSDVRNMLTLDDFDILIDCVYTEEQESNIDMDQANELVGKLKYEMYLLKNETGDKR